MELAVGHQGATDGWSLGKESVKLGTLMSTVSHDQARWLERMKRLARHREGRCLSTEYINNHTKMRWRCKFGHEWEAIPNSVAPHDGFRGSWCPTCAGKLPKEEMLRACQELA